MEDTRVALNVSRSLLSKTDAACSLGVSVRSIDRLIDDGSLDVVKIRRTVRIPMSSLEKLISGGGCE